MTNTGGEAPSIVVPSRLQLFLGFTHIASLAFGGVLPWAHFVLVERRRWLSNEDFTETLALCQVLPGPNIVNMSVAIGARFHGPSGATVSFLGLMSLPIAMLLAVAGIYERYADVAAVKNGLVAVAAAAAGLIVAMAVKLARPLLRRRPLAAFPVILATFASVGLMRWPLWPVFLTLVPLSIAVGWRAR